MSRSNNAVYFLGKVIKGVTARYTSEGKPRASYQVEIQGRSIDKGAIQTPFVKSVGNQAAKDIEHIKVGDVILVEGRITTREEKKTLSVIKDPNNPQKMLTYDETDENITFVVNPSDIYKVDVTRTVTEVLATDVTYVSDLLSMMEPEQALKVFTPDVLRYVLNDYEEKYGDLDPVIKALTEKKK
jgi:primosomal replication protein N